MIKRINGVDYEIVAIYTNGWTAYNTDEDGGALFSDEIDTCNQGDFDCYEAYLDGESTGYYGETIDELVKMIKGEDETAVDNASGDIGDFCFTYTKEKGFTFIDIGGNDLLDINPKTRRLLLSSIIEDDYFLTSMGYHGKVDNAKKELKKLARKELDNE